MNLPLSAVASYYYYHEYYDAILHDDIFKRLNENTTFYHSNLFITYIKCVTFQHLKKVVMIDVSSVSLLNISSWSIAS